MTSQFYLILPSNSSFDYFPQNTLASYKTKLSKKISLVGEWEVGLAEFQYLRSWHNLNAEEARLRFSVSQQGDVHDVNLKPGKYDDCEQLVDAISEALSSYVEVNTITLKFNKISKRVYLTVKAGEAIWFAETLSQMLGFGTRTVFVGPILELEGENVCDINRGFYNLYCYCSLAEPIMVGDTQVPLLRIVPITGKHGDFVTQTYQSIQYVPLNHKEFDTVEINIKDDTGKSVPFETGKVVVVLHLRRRHSPFLI